MLVTYDTVKIFHSRLLLLSMPTMYSLKWGWYINLLTKLLLRRCCSTFSIDTTEDITADVNCIDLFILWKPVSGALQYRLRFRENNEKKVIFRNETVDRPIFKAKLSDFKVKVFSVEVSTHVCVYVILLED